MDEVLWRGAERQEELVAIRELFPESTLVPRLLQEPPPRLLRSALATRIREAVDGRRSFAGIQLAVHGSEYHVGRHLVELFTNGCLVVMAPERAAEEAEAAAEEAVPLEEGDALFRRGRFEEALRIFRAALDRGHERSDLQKLVQATEQLLLEQIYSEDVPADAVPQRVWDEKQILAGSFSPEEYFLIDQVNGRWSAKAVVGLSPLREVDALLVLRDLLRRRVLKLLERWGGAKPERPRRP
jgi:pentatricopeptide repeat protein